MDCARRLLIVAGGCMVLLANTGCLRVSPKMPKVLATAAPIEYSTSAFDADIASYHSAVTAGNLDAAKTIRNQIVFRVMAQIDTAYDKFESELDTHRAGYQTSTDAAQLGLTTAATLVGASAVKDILSSTATALQGATLSFDKNFFEQKTTASMVSQMRASRKTLQAQMLLNLSTRDVQSYPLEAAWTDVVNYYYAGTIPSALVDISSKTGNDALQADQNLKAVVKALTPSTPVQAHMAISIRSEYQRLSQQIASGDPTQVSSAADELQKIFTAAQISCDAKASPAELLDLFKKAMSDAADDDAKLDKLNTAVQSAAQP